ncbi:MAG: peptidase M23 [Bacteroidetes bacterium]|nr:MAG: peptidase M23 [Bacteroidota bacterium]
MNDLISILIKNQVLFERPVLFNPEKDSLLLMDFTKDNRELNDEILSDTRSFTTYILGRLEKEKARYGIGGYAEYREVYSRSRVFDGEHAGQEPRRLHLGVDIWGKPNTAVIAPLDAIVHSFAFNDQPGDYGATIILTHQLEGLTFYTLYGHLSLNSICNRYEGERIEKGDLFAEFGIPMENGHWPPHLHFQLIRELGDWSGDYPGVCKYSEKEKYLENSPDPDLILGMMQYAKR